MSDNVNRAYRDSVFCLLFNDKARLIELYNALYDTDYDMETPLNIDTIEDVFFVNMKNDIAFTIDNKFIVLTEHQSTINPNMPLRDLFYISAIYQQKLDTKKLYSRTVIRIPRPEFLVFYNGAEDMPCYWEYRLEDSYLGEPAPGEKNTLNLTVKVYNINKEKDSAILRKSRSMGGYSELISRIKHGMTGGKLTHDAIKKAVENCISDGILPDFLEKYASEVVGMLYKKFTDEEIIELYTEDGYHMGYEQGVNETKLDMAAKLKEHGMEIDFIVKCTGLTPEEIDAI